MGALSTADAKALTDAIDAASRAGTRPGPPVLRTVFLASSTPDAAPLVLDVFALHTRQAFELWSFAPRVLIVARGPRGTERQKSAMLQAIYGLTPAECEIALRLTSGRSVDQIAIERASTVGTVRGQVKSVLLKMGLSKQIELPAIIARL